MSQDFLNFFVFGQKTRPWSIITTWKDLVKFSVYALSYIRGHTNFEPIIVGIKRKISPTPFVLLIKNQIAYHHSFLLKATFWIYNGKILRLCTFLQQSFAALKAGLGIWSSVFRAIRLVFVSERAKKWYARAKEQSLQSLFCHEWPERIAHNNSFVQSNLSDSLTVTL